MAEIKIKKTATPWWVWAIIAVLAAAVIWWFVARQNDDGAYEEAVPATPVAEGEAAASREAGSTEGPVTDLTLLLESEASPSLVGREVRLQGVKVQSMVGDATFWVGPDSERRIFVVLDEEIPAPPPDVEGRVNVNAGQTVDVQGVVRDAADLPSGDVLDAEGQRALSGQTIYVWARATQVATRP